VNIVDPILFHARSIPMAPAIAAPGQNMNLISYGRLAQAIHNVGRKAISMGLARKNIVAVSVEDIILHAAIILGLTRIGVVTFQGGASQVPAGLKVDAAIRDRLGPGSAVQHKLILADRSWMTGDGKPLVDAHYKTAPDDVCRIVLTSGTTGEPKAVAITHDMLAKRIARHHYMMGNQLSQAMRLHCDFSFGASLGFQFLVYMLWKGGTLFCGGGDIDATIQTFDLYKVQVLLGSPASLSGFTRFYELNSWAHSRFELAIVGGAQVHQTLSERARARFCTNIIAAYGATETSMVATAPAHALADVEGAVGYVTPDVAIEIVDDDARAVPVGAEGTVRIRGPYSVGGYLGSPEHPQAAFRDGCFHPGDFGRVTADGMLVITGRTQSVMNIAGDKAKPEKIEGVLRSFRGIEDAAVVAVRNDLGIDQIWAAVVASSIDEKALRAHCEARLAPMLVPIRFVPVEKLPRNEMGKLERDTIARMLKGKAAGPGLANYLPETS